jgi:hypothetical protein
MHTIAFDVRRHGLVWGILNLVGALGFVVAGIIIAGNTGHPAAYLLSVMGMLFGTLGSVMSFRYARQSRDSYRIVFRTESVVICTGDSEREIPRGAIVALRITTKTPASSLSYEAPREQTTEIQLVDGGFVSLPIQPNDGWRHRKAEMYGQMIGIPIERIRMPGSA